MSICINCGRLMLKGSKYCPECGAEANDKFSCIYECVRKNVGITPLHTIIAYCGISREQAVPYLKKLKSMKYVTGNIRDGYVLTATGAGIFKEKKPSKEENIEAEIKLVFEYLCMHKDAGLSQISKELNIPILKVRDALKKLKERGKITS
jgi:Mn-dependent DtxR family transcriptional regulator